MPTYDYECSNCSSSFELFQKMTDKPIKKCPQCGKNTAKRLIGSGIGIIFKGSGFYETDYKRNKTGSQAKESGSDSTNTAANNDGSKKSSSADTKGKKTKANKKDEK